MLHRLAVVAPYQTLGRRRENCNGVVDPRRNLIAIMQVGKIGVWSTAAVVIWSSEVATVSAGYCITFVKLADHGWEVD